MWEREMGTGLGKVHKLGMKLETSVAQQHYMAIGANQSMFSTGRLIIQFSSLFV